jgi:hypothetical protein
MIMKMTFLPPKPGQTGSALMLTMVMTGVALAILAGAMTWSANSTRLTHRSIQYTRSIAAAEAATEKVLSRMTKDFQAGGEKVVRNNADSYRKMVPTTADSLFWKDWEFTDGSDHAPRTYVQGPNSSTQVVLTSPYAGLRAFASTWTVVSHASDNASLQQVVAGVLQEVQLALIPIFQYAMYS